MKKSLRSLLLVAALAAHAPITPAEAKDCLPSTAERVLETLLEAVPDESPLHEQAWTIADDQEAAGAFESPETIRLLNDAAVAGGYVFECGSRRYVRADGTPTEEQEEEEEEEENEATGPSNGGGGPVAGIRPDGGSTPAPTTGRSNPVATGGNPQTPAPPGAEGSEAGNSGTGDPAAGGPVAQSDAEAARAGLPPGRELGDDAEGGLGEALSTETLDGDDRTSERSAARSDGTGAGLPLWIYLAVGGLAPAAALAAWRKRRRHRW